MRKIITYQQIADYNPYEVSAELENSLTRNQRDVLDYYMMVYRTEDATIYDLVDFLKYINGFTLSHKPDEDDCNLICQMFTDFLKK
jgi:hypothetical protein